MKFSRRFFIALFVSAHATQADVVLTKEQLDEVARARKNASELSKLASQYDQMARQVEEFSQKRNVECQMAFGDKNFCKCLSEKLPYVLSFSDYIALITHDKDSLNTAELTKDETAVMEKAISVRNECIKLL